MMKSRKYQKGQATAEMMVALIGIMTFFGESLLLAELCIANVRNILETRGETDVAAYNGFLGMSGVSIRFWEKGADTLLYTADDEAQTGTIDNGGTFASELANAKFSLMSDFSKDYVRNNFSTELLETSSLFINAADLTSASKTSRVYFATWETKEKVAGSIPLRDTLYMPFIMTPD